EIVSGFLVLIGVDAPVLVVCGEMLGACDDALRLDRLYFLKRDFRIQVWVLALTGDIAAPIGQASDIHHRSEKHVHVGGPSLAAFDGPIGIRELPIKAGRQRNRLGHRHGIVPAVDSARPVYPSQRRNSQPRYAWGISRLSAGDRIIDPHDHGELLFSSELREKLHDSRREDRGGISMQRKYSDKRGCE